MTDLANEISLLGSGSQKLLAGGCQNFQKLGIRALDRQTSCLFRVDHGVPLGAEHHRSTEKLGVFDAVSWFVVNELDPNWRDRLAGQVPTALHDRGSKVFRGVPQPAQLGIDHPKPKRHVRAEALDLTVMSFTPHLVEALYV